MILRRVIDHVRKQEWTAIFIDFLIVVVGVFVGIQVSNWNAARADRQAYDEAVVRLRAEIADNFELLDLAEADINAELPVVRAAYDALETCSDAPETARAVNAGVLLIRGTNSIQLKDSALLEVTSSPHLLSKQSPAIRRRFSDLLFYQTLVIDTAEDYENYPRQSRAESISVLRPGPRARQDTTYLGIAISEDRRPLQLNAPVSEACKNGDLIAALWSWDRAQGTLLTLSKKMRQEYQMTLDLLDKGSAP